MNHNLLAEFCRDSEGLLGPLLTQSLTALIAEGQIPLEEVAIDGTKIEARASRGSMAKRKRLERIEAAVSERVASLKRELEQDPAAAERKRRTCALRAAQEHEARVQRAKQRLVNRSRRSRSGPNARPRRKQGSPPRACLSDPELRMMRMADGAVRPAWNLQVAAAKGFIVAIEPTDRRNDTGLAPASVKQVVERCGKAPERLLADQTAMTQGDIAALAEAHPQLEVYSPPPEEREDVTAETLRNCRYHRHEPEAMKQWRARMASEEGKVVYARRKFTEHVRAKMKNRGFGRMLVNTVRRVCLLHALAHNLMQACFLRDAAAEAAVGAAVG